MYKSIIRPILFKFDPEKIHHFTFTAIKFGFMLPFIAWVVRKIFSIEDKSLERKVMGLTFKNPVGLAAGFDKNAVLYNQLADFGFGFIEIGTVTPKAQDGNPKKRLFRLLDDQGIINRMGFNNAGVASAVEQLKKNKGKVLIGGNIGKNTGIPEDQITSDYVTCFRALHPLVDYFVVNVSCPNVGATAKLQDKDYLIELLNTLQTENKTHASRKPIVLKIAPDLNNQQLDDMIEVIAETKIDGIIASNTSVDRTGLKTPTDILEAIGNGGVSGKPIADKSTHVIQYLSEKSNKAFAIIGVGGIHSAQDAINKLNVGADLIQLYTGFIYEGPAIVKHINKALLRG